MQMTVDNNGSVRIRSILKTTVSGLLSRGISIATSLLMVPLALGYLGREQYGLWIAVSSLIGMLAFMDGGAGNAVINMVSEAAGSKSEKITQIVSTAFFSLLFMGLLFSLAFIGFFPLIPWETIFGISDTSLIKDLDTVVLVSGLFFCTTIFITLVGKIQKGFQEGYLDSYWTSLGAVLSLLFAFLVVRLGLGFGYFVTASLAGLLFAYLASNLHYFFLKKRDIIPRISNFDSDTARHIFSTGGLFLVLQIAASIQAQSDNVLIAFILGPEAVTNYAICMKLFLIVPMLCGLAFAPLWPAYRSAYSSGDTLWIKTTFLRSIRWSLYISVPSAIALLFLGDEIIRLWTGHETAPSQYLLVGCSLWLVIVTVSSALAAFLNGLEIVRPQIYLATSATVLNIVLSIWLIRIFGAVGAVWGSVISYVVLVILPYYIIIQKMLIKM